MPKVPKQEHLLYLHCSLSSVTKNIQQNKKGWNLIVTLIQMAVLYLPWHLGSLYNKQCYAFMISKVPRQVLLACFNSFIGMSNRNVFSLSQGAKAKAASVLDSLASSTGSWIQHICRGIVQQPMQVQLVYLSYLRYSHPNK